MLLTNNTNFNLYFFTHDNNYNSRIRFDYALTSENIAEYHASFPVKTKKKYRRSTSIQIEILSARGRPSRYICSEFTNC